MQLRSQPLDRLLQLLNPDFKPAHTIFAKAIA
jgi:hypothetical protein